MINNVLSFHTLQGISQGKRKRTKCAGQDAIKAPNFGAPAKFAVSLMRGCEPLLAMLRQSVFMHA